MDDATKRKRESDLEALPDAKRLAPTVATAEECRAALAEVYAAYDALHRSNGNGENSESHFAVLLNASTGESHQQESGGEKQSHHPLPAIFKVLL